MTGHMPVFGGIVGIVAACDTLEIRELCLDCPDEITVGHELLDLPLVSVKGHVLQGNRHQRVDVSTGYKR